jgi:adenylosuccinate lyase
MIERYTRPAMGKIWEQQNRYQKWLDVELAACYALHKIGIIPDVDYKIITEKASFDAKRIDDVEKVTKHDIIAFLSVVAENVGEPSRWIHYGMTSSDVLDTATSLQCREAGDLILTNLLSLCEVLERRANETKNILCIGRSHGIHAEPTSFGLKFALWFDEMQRNIKRLETATRDLSVGKISGAVGNYAHLNPEVEKIACEYLGLKPVNIGTQVIQRDLHANFLNAISLTASTLEKIAVEIRHLQRTEVLEAEECFSKGQKGSSAMPHKKNPITSEQITGLARLLRSNALAAIENNALWHERDISHSSVERIILPDSCILIHYMLEKTITLIDTLKIYENNIKKNLELTNGLVFSQVLLLKLAESGMQRDDAYSKVQKHALICWENKTHLKELVQNDNDIMQYISKEELEEVFSYNRYMTNVNYIFDKVFSMHSTK